MSELGDQLAVLCVALGVSAGAAVLLATRQALFAIRVAVDFWVAAGLIRLTGDVTWSTLASAAGIVAIRQLLNLALRLSPLHDGMSARGN
jgi:hypothetical protein